LLIRPDSISERAVAEAILPFVRSDIPTLIMRARHVPPCIVYACFVGESSGAIDALRRIGCEAFAPSESDILALGPTMKIRDLSLCAEGLAIELWRSGSHTVNPDDIDVIVRAKMSEQLGRNVDRTNARELAQNIGRLGGIHLAGLGWAMGGGFGLAAGLYASRLYAGEGIESAPSPTARLSAKLDLHTRDGTVYQIDGDKFGFEILGDQRGYSDMVNIDRMCEYLAALAPSAAIDPYSGLFKPPPGVERVRIAQRAMNCDHPTFAFYSRWAALVYRYLASRWSP
jgi:hypothetical protein